MSLMIVRSASPEVRIVLTKFRCSEVSLVSMRMLVIPMTPFMGVRISCDIAARNSLFARDAASASALARRSWLSVSTRDVMSVSIAMKFSTWPAWLRTTWTSRGREYFLPDLEYWTISVFVPMPLAISARIRSAWAASVSGPTSSCPGSLPTTSSSVYSMTRQKAPLTHSIFPSADPMMTRLSVFDATSESLRDSAWLSRSACSDSRLIVMSWTVPMIRMGRPLEPARTDFDRTYTQRQSPETARTRYSGSMNEAIPLSWDSVRFL